MADLDRRGTFNSFLDSLPEDFFLAVARLFMSATFIIFGIGKYINMGMMASYIEKAGIPGQLIYIVIPFQILNGLAVLLGYYTRVAAFLLGGFCVIATILYHNEWHRSGELASFTKDFAMAGGFLFMWFHGPGRYSLDYQRSRKNPSAFGLGRRWFA